MSYVDNSRLSWSPFQEELCYMPEEEAFQLIGGQSVINRYRMYDHEGKPNMVNTAWVMNAVVFHRRMQHDFHSKLKLANHGWEISIDHLLPPSFVDQAIAHAIGHLMIMKYDIQHHKELYLIGKEYSESNWAVEDLSELIAHRLLQN